jgi:hypothetical protein
MNYNEFLFYNLAQKFSNHPLCDMEYDTAFNSVEDYYEMYYTSDYYNESAGEYVCIVNYLKNYVNPKNVINNENLREELEQYFEVDIDNCEMTHKSWISEVVLLMTTNYKNELLKEVEFYQQTKNQ